MEGNSCEKPDKGRGRALVLAGGVVSLLSLLMLISAGFGARLGLWHFRTGFDLLKYAAYSGIAATVINIVVILAAVSRNHFRNLLFGLLAICICLPSAAIPFYWKWKAGRLPRIHDISTDTVRPPRFVALIPLRKNSPNPLEPADAQVVAKQHEAYPDIKSLTLNMAKDQAFAKVFAVARDMKWEIVAAVPEEGRIEAIDTTFWFGFKDDIVIRITPAESNRSLLDVRSVSRVGVSDVGKNAARIRSFLERMSK